jgi:hypothetical protein
LQPKNLQNPTGFDGIAADMQKNVDDKNTDGRTAILAGPHDETNPIVSPGSQ